MPKRTVTIRMDPELIERAKAQADRRGWSLSQWLATAARRVVEGEEADQRRATPKGRR